MAIPWVFISMVLLQTTRSYHLVRSQIIIAIKSNHKDWIGVSAKQLGTLAALAKKQTLV